MAKILVAEDERDIRDLIGFILRFANHEVTLVENGEEAVKAAGEIMPDLIMMDVRMPKMTGYEACQRMKTDDKVKHIPVVFLSAKGQEAEIRTGLDMGAAEYLLKPFAPMDLTERVKEILARYGKV